MPPAPISSGSTKGPERPELARITLRKRPTAAATRLCGPQLRHSTGGAHDGAGQRRRGRAPPPRRRRRAASSPPLRTGLEPRGRAQPAAAAALDSERPGGLPRCLGRLPRRGLAARRPRGDVAARRATWRAYAAVEAPASPSIVCDALARRRECQPADHGHGAGGWKRSQRAGVRGRVLAAAYQFIEK